MVDELDPALEARLRDALRIEATSVPFAITAADVCARRGRRRRSTPARQLLAVLAAAVVVVLVGALGAAWIAGGPTVPVRPAPSTGPSATPSAGTSAGPTAGASGSPAANASASPAANASAPASSGLAAALPSLEELRRSLVQDSPGIPILLRGERDGVTGDPAAPADLGELPPVQVLDIAYACAGGTIAVSSVVEGTTTLLFSTTCSGNAERVGSTPEMTQRAHLVVAAGAGVAWRLVVGGWSTGSPSVDPAVMDVGRPGEAVVVRTEGDPGRPSAVIVDGVAPSTAGEPLRPREIARVHGPVLAADRRLAQPLAAKASVDGRLALALDTAGDAAPSVVVADLRTGAWTTLEVALDELAFGPDGRMAWFDGSGALQVETAPGAPVQVPAERPVVRSANGAGSPVWLRLIGGGLLGASDDGTGVPSFAAVHEDGTTLDLGPGLPALWGATGLERPYGAGGWTLSVGCDSACVLVRTLGDATRPFGDFRGNVDSTGWAADGLAAWVLQPQATPTGQDARELVLERVDPDGGVSDRTVLEPAASNQAGAILGVRDGDTAEAPELVVRGQRGTLYLVSRGRASVLDGAFAGWGGGTGTYPAP